MAVLSPKYLRGGGTATHESLWLCLKWSPYERIHEFFKGNQMMGLGTSSPEAEAINVKILYEF